MARIEARDEPVYETVSVGDIELLETVVQASRRPELEYHGLSGVPTRDVKALRYVSGSSAFQSSEQDYNGGPSVVELVDRMNV